MSKDIEYIVASLVEVLLTVSALALFFSVLYTLVYFFFLCFDKGKSGSSTGKFIHSIYFSNRYLSDKGVNRKSKLLKGLLATILFFIIFLCASLLSDSFQGVVYDEAFKSSN